MALPPQINLVISDIKVDPIEIERVKIDIEPVKIDIKPVKVKVCLDKKLINLIIFMFVIILLIVIAVIIYKVFKVKMMAGKSVY